VLLAYRCKRARHCRRDRFLAEIDKVTPWSQLHQLIEPFNPKVVDAGRWMKYPIKIEE